MSDVAPPAGRLYLDTSALVKLFVTEPGTDAVESLVAGRSDLVVSDLVVTETISAVARRVRSGHLIVTDARRIHRRLLDDLDLGYFLASRSTRDVHREAERFLLRLECPLRAADALHLALAAAQDASTFVTFDDRLREAASATGLAVAP